MNFDGRVKAIYQPDCQLQNTKTVHSNSINIFFEYDTILPYNHCFFRRFDGQTLKFFINKNYYE
ncbi:hypothetical protein A9Z64_04010 [Moraxella osloensis]|nr:hypothetical protein AXE82_00580 [Moraxella osloensis]OBX51351.1 hypothetical protein A9Z64_04010 [Moraxella osloensis]